MSMFWRKHQVFKPATFREVSPTSGSWWRSGVAHLIELPERPAGGFIVVLWSGLLDGMSYVFLLPRRSRTRGCGVLQPRHLLVDGGLRAPFDATAGLGLTGNDRKSADNMLTVHKSRLLNKQGSKMQRKTSYILKEKSKSNVSGPANETNVVFVVSCSGSLGALSRQLRVKVWFAISRPPPNPHPILTCKTTNVRRRRRRKSKTATAETMYRRAGVPEQPHWPVTITQSHTHTHRRSYFLHV